MIMFIWTYLQGCLKMDPAERLTCNMLLHHPYIGPNMEMVTEGKRDTVNRKKNNSRVSNYPMVSCYQVCAGSGKLLQGDDACRNTFY